MNLPLPISYLPMEAVTAAKIPEGPQWQYEPKWDGFRCLAFRDGDEVELQSKAGQPLARYFPELVSTLKELKAKRFVLDGEIVISVEGKLSFDDLLQRIHPAASRVQKLSQQTPATLIVFDLLVDDYGKLLAELPLSERRPKLDTFAEEFLGGHKSLTLSPATTDVKSARGWLKDAGGSIDGVVAKRSDLPYQTGERTGMVKIKNLRSADCVIGGFRYAEKEKVVGSLLLGLYDDEGLLNHVGFCSGIAAAQKRELTTKLEKLVEPPGFTGKAPGGPSRWSTERSAEWQPLATKLVVEVRYDHFTQGRFRHGTKLLRWRPDKAPEQCKMSQVDG